MRHIFCPVIFFGAIATLFIYGNNLDPKSLDDWRGYFLLGCMLVLVFSWYFAPIRVIWLCRLMRNMSVAERVIKRNQIIGWISAWSIISIALFVSSQLQNGFWRQLFRH